MLLASSATALYDIWGAARGRVLAVQGHPEMQCSTALRKILPAVKGCAALRQPRFVVRAFVTALRRILPELQAVITSLHHSTLMHWSCDEFCADA